MTIDVTDPIFADENKAREHLEGVRWPLGPICPHCGVTGEATKLEGAKHRPGVYQCNACRAQFTVTVGTVFESSKVPLYKWLLATHFLCAGKKGISAHQLHRMLGVTYKTAWFMAHRIREAMKPDGKGGLGGPGKVIEADETYIGKRETPVVSAQRKDRPYKNKNRGVGDKRAIVALVERGGQVRSFHVKDLNKDSVVRIIRTNAHRTSGLMTDESKLYTEVGGEFARHGTVNHSAKEYVRDDVTTNTVEGFFGIFKRGMKGIYQHCGEQHLHRYLTEFDFRYNNRIKLGVHDTERTEKALRGIEGKRLTYRRADEAGHA